jgi:putative transposase
MADPRACDRLPYKGAAGLAALEEWQGQHRCGGAGAGAHFQVGSLWKVSNPLLLRSANGLVFISRHYTRLVRSYGFKQEFITPHCPQQNGLVERVIRTLKEQCVHRHRFEIQTHAMRVIADWIAFYNNRRPHQALGMITPPRAYELAA